MILRCVLPLAVLASALQAEVAEFEIKAGQHRTVTLPSLFDDSNYAEPLGYAGHGGQKRWFTRSIEISNTGKKPLTGRLLTVENRDWMSMDGLRRTLGLSSEPEKQALSMARLYTFWRNHRSHAGTGSPLANEPFAALNFWGYTLCGEDTQALARLAFGCGITARHVQLNGHIAGEYFYDNAWHMVDGDQDAIYLKLDNQTLASADELRADPFLSLRSRVFGRHSPRELSASAFNTALIEHVSVDEPKPIKLKVGPAPLSNFTLPVGETLVWHCDTPPEKVAGKMLTEKPDALRVAALASIEHRALASNWQPSEGTVKLTSPFPIWKAVNETTGKAVEIPSGEPVFRVNVPVKSGDDKITIYSQCSRGSVPEFRRGDNVAQLNSKEGAATVRVSYEPVKDVPVPGIKIAAREPVFSGPPSFTITASPQPEVLWWQVSNQRDFSFVAPSLEGVIPASPDLRFDELSDTFLSPGAPYFIRVKARADGIWSEWSESVGFRVAKPAAPTDVTFESSRARYVSLSWKSPDKDAEYLIFGSNRRDFVPEVYSTSEIAEMDHLTVTKQRDNRNRVGLSKAKEYEFAPEHRFYRIIARRGRAFSVPSPLIELPEEFAKGLPPATILQARAENRDGKDRYRVTEMPLPTAKPTKPAKREEPKTTKADSAPKKETQKTPKEN